MNNLLLRMGLISRRMRWGITIKGFLGLILLMVALLSILVLTVHKFLAISEPLDSAELLLIDGPIPEYAIDKAISEFEQGQYQLLVTTGGPISRGYLVTDLGTYPELVAKALVHQNFDEQKIIVVTRDAVATDRTFANAVAMREWLAQQSNDYTGINIFCMGAHARRTRLLYQKALNNTVNVGVLAANNLEYDQHNWWKSSAGFRMVTGEGIAYLYARFFFASDN